MKGTVLHEKSELVVMNSELDAFGNKHARGDVRHMCAQLRKPYEAVVTQNPASPLTYIFDNY
jgi:hypothetical protein